VVSTISISSRRESTNVVSNLSAGPPRDAMGDLASLKPPLPMSCNDVVLSMVLESSVSWPHSLRTAEATGSNLSGTNTSFRPSVVGRGIR
jgi:hypothetical protein